MTLTNNNSDIGNGMQLTKQTFLAYRVEFDEFHDLYEKLVKKSRDNTIESKRIIFLLHRRNTSDSDKKTLSEAKNRLKEVYKKIIFGIGSLLVGRDLYQFMQSYTPGIQEFIEALAFYYYLSSEKVISLQQIYDGKFLFEEDMSEIELAEENGLPMSDLLDPMDYILGLADFTGELMRKCISSGNLEEPFRLRTVLKDVYCAFLMMGSSGGRELSRKLWTLKTSLQKVEFACYNLQVRGSELEKLDGGRERIILADVFGDLEPSPSMDESPL